MTYHSLNDSTHTTSFKNAVIKGIAPDKGLYFPSEIPFFENSFWQKASNLSLNELALTVIQPLVGDEIPKKRLEQIINKVLHFDFPLLEIEPGLHILELFHGPTLAFKDVGARFMAECLGYFLENEDKEVTVLVATSGDTGGAVANGFLGVTGVKVVILYPKGKVSEIQEKQLTTLGNNIVALEVDGNFDDCQRMVKTAFLDTDITLIKKLTSANSINVARWLPQMFYYLSAYQKASKSKKEIVFCVPSGNFGNICAGMMAHKMGLPVFKFIAATNSNDTIPRFMNSGVYEPLPTQPTLSNAMDVSDPSNFIRIQQLFGHTKEDLGTLLSTIKVSEIETIKSMKTVYQNNAYLLDPHGAVAYFAAKQLQPQLKNCNLIVLETAHPIKFLPTIKNTLGLSPEVPAKIKPLLTKKKVSIPLNNYLELKSFLLQNS